MLVSIDGTALLPVPSVVTVETASPVADPLVATADGVVADDCAGCSARVFPWYLDGEVVVVTVFLEEELTRVAAATVENLKLSSLSGLEDDPLSVTFSVGKLLTLLSVPCVAVVDDLVCGCSSFATLSCDNMLPCDDDVIVIDVWLSSDERPSASVGPGVVAAEGADA